MAKNRKNNKDLSILKFILNALKAICTCLFELALGLIELIKNLKK